jgi:aminoglycoside/choline kinase family phosphotransferase
LPTYDDAVYLREVALFSDWYLPQHCGIDASKKLRAEYIEIWQQLLATNNLQQHVLVHRDYHADNLLWHAHAGGVARVAMLDYQDALYGDSAYDLVSLLEDARRDVSAETAKQCIGYYAQHAGENLADFSARYALLGAQRNAKIIGIFARLAVRDNKPHYLHYLPRVWQHFLRDLEHPSLLILRQWLDANVPAQWRQLSAVRGEIGGIA